MTQLTREQCSAHLSSRGIGRVSLSIGAMPVIIPVVYLVDDDSVLFQAPLDRSFADACDGSVIAFEVDDMSTSAGHGMWSVHAVGMGSRLDEREHLHVQSLGAGTFATSRVDQIVRLPTQRLSGHELHATPVAGVG